MLSLVVKNTHPSLPLYSLKTKWAKPWWYHAPIQTRQRQVASDSAGKIPPDSWTLVSRSTSISISTASANAQTVATLHDTYTWLWEVWAMISNAGWPSRPSPVLPPCTVVHLHVSWAPCHQQEVHDIKCLISYCNFICRLPWDCKGGWGLQNHPACIHLQITITRSVSGQLQKITCSFLTDAPNFRRGADTVQSTCFWSGLS